MTNSQPLWSSPSREARATRAMLGAGVVAGAFFVLVSLAQAFTRDGFDLRRHAFSMLSLGDLGWLQIANFVLAGTLFLVAGLGARRALGGRRAGAILIMIFGVSQIAGGVFVVDPALGFPVGTADRVPDQLSWHGTLHTVAFAVHMGALVAACAVWSRTFRSRGLRRWSGYSAATAAAFVLLAAIGVTSADFRIVTVAIIIGWGWASLVCARLRDPGSLLPTPPAQPGTVATKEETQL